MVSAGSCGPTFSATSRGREKKGGMSDVLVNFVVVLLQIKL